METLNILGGTRVSFLDAMLHTHLRKREQRHTYQCCQVSTLRRFPTLFPTFVQDVGQSILESYSRVMESLAFNIMARIDDVLYVDDATKRCAAAESVSLFSRGGLGGLPIQKRMSPSPFSIQHTPYASPFATPTFCSLLALVGFLPLHTRMG